MNDALSQGDISLDTRPEIWGRGHPGETFTLYADNVPLGSVTTLQNGFWSFIPQQDLPAGKITLHTRNLQGEEGSQFELSITSAYHDYGIRADDSSVAIVDYVHERFSENATLIGTGPSHAAIQILDLLSGQAMGQVQTDEHGFWMFPMKLEEGHYQMVAQGASTSSSAFGVDLTLHYADADRFTPSMFIHDDILFASESWLFASGNDALSPVQANPVLIEPERAIETTNGIMVNIEPSSRWHEEPEHYQGTS